MYKNWFCTIKIRYNHHNSLKVDIKYISGMLNYFDILYTVEVATIMGQTRLEGFSKAKGIGLVNLTAYQPLMNYLMPEFNSFLYYSNHN